ncbi:MAG: alpha/beta hydrolase-fold protein [Pseudomonadaceae bacterium]|nr:alpha/beta hydrolase-fold protein [Pseudomonadaceae bacterium]
MAAQMPLDIETHLALGLDQPTPDSVNGCSNADVLKALQHPADRVYHPCAEAYPEADVAAGTVSKYKDWSATDIYAGTIRDVAVYIPTQISSATPANVLICNDGMGYLARNGPVRVTAVLDSLLAKGEIQPTVAIFVNPGRPPGAKPFGGTSGYDAAADQRRIEYDTLSPAYGSFLADELMPWVADENSLTFSDKPADRTVCGISSGGICAFSAAWFAPQHFGRVISHCGSFTNICGGHNFPYLVQSTQRKDLRVFLQSGANDAQTLFGDWPTANQAMAKALAYAGYDFRFEFGAGGHTLRHGGALFADTLRWLWR